MDHSDIGRRIKEERLRQGLSLRHLAEKSGVSHSHIDEIEKGTVATPSMKMVSQIWGRGLGKDLGELSGSGEEPAPGESAPYNPAATIDAVEDLITELARRSKTHDTAELEELLRLVWEMEPEDRTRFRARARELAGIRRAERRFWEDMQRPESDDQDAVQGNDLA